MATAEMRLPEWTLGDRIRKARRLAGLTQEDLGHLVGVSDKAIDNWEKDRNPPKDYLYQRLVEVLTEHGVDPRFFPLRGTKPTQPKVTAAKVRALPSAKRPKLPTPVSAGRTLRDVAA